MPRYCVDDYVKTAKTDQQEWNDHQSTYDHYPNLFFKDLRIFTSDLNLNKERINLK
jgi:hypothetical protein